MSTTAPGPLGHIVPADRTAAQTIAHADAMAVVPPAARFALPVPKLAKGEKLVLTDHWSAAAVKTDLGRAFIRELQNTGSCVKVGGSNALRCTIAAQRVAAQNPTTAFEPYCWHNYAMSRHYMGDDGRGEGSMGSTFAKSLLEDGVRDWPQDVKDALPDYTHTGDHIDIPAAQEMAWSSYRNPEVQKMLALTRQNKLGTAAECRSTDDIKAAVLNGYGVSFACNDYIGDAKIQGSGADAVVVGYWNGRGGHQQWVFGYYEHPTLGPLFAVGNNWADGTYPKDPAGLPLCTCWVTEAKVNAALGLDAEVFALAHQNWLSATPDLLNWVV